MRRRNEKVRRGNFGLRVRQPLVFGNGLGEPFHFVERQRQVCMSGVIAGSSIDDPLQNRLGVSEFTRLNQCGGIAGSVLRILWIKLERAVVVILRPLRINPAIRGSQAREYGGVLRVALKQVFQSCALFGAGIGRAGDRRAECDYFRCCSILLRQSIKQSQGVFAIAGPRINSRVRDGVRDFTTQTGLLEQPEIRNCAFKIVYAGTHAGTVITGAEVPRAFYQRLIKAGNRGQLISGVLFDERAFAPGGRVCRRLQSCGFYQLQSFIYVS